MSFNVSRYRARRGHLPLLAPKSKRVLSSLKSSIGARASFSISNLPSKTFKDTQRYASRSSVLAQVCCHLSTLASQANPTAESGDGSLHGGSSRSLILHFQHHGNQDPTNFRSSTLKMHGKQVWIVSVPTQVAQVRICPTVRPIKVCFLLCFVHGE